MRPLHLSLFLLLVLCALRFTQAQNKTDAQLDGLSGPVKSVSSTVIQTPNLKWQQAGGPTLVAPNWCRNCEYDPDGSKTQSGQMVDGKFFGETLRLAMGKSSNVIPTVPTENFNATNSLVPSERSSLSFGSREN